MADGRITRLRTRATDATAWVAGTAWRPVVIGRAVDERDRDIAGGLLAGALSWPALRWLPGPALDHRDPCPAPSCSRWACT